MELLTAGTSIRFWSSGVERNTLFSYLKERGVGVNVHYIPIYKFELLSEALSPGRQCFSEHRGCIQQDTDAAALPRYER